MDPGACVRSPREPGDYWETMKNKFEGKTASLQAQEMELKQRITQMEALLAKHQPDDAFCPFDSHNLNIPKIFPKRPESPVRDVPRRVIRDPSPSSPKPCSPPSRKEPSCPATFFQKVMENAKSILTLKCNTVHPSPPHAIDDQPTRETDNACVGDTRPSCGSTHDNSTTLPISCSIGCLIAEDDTRNDITADSYSQEENNTFSLSCCKNLMTQTTLSTGTMTQSKKETTSITCQSNSTSSRTKKVNSAPTSCDGGNSASKTKVSSTSQSCSTDVEQEVNMSNCWACPFVGSRGDAPNTANKKAPSAKKPNTSRTCAANLSLSDSSSDKKDPAPAAGKRVQIQGTTLNEDNQCSFVGSPMLRKEDFRGTNQTCAPHKDSIFSIDSHDLQNLRAVADLATKEKEIKCHIKELQVRERNYNSQFKGNTPSCICNAAAGKPNQQGSNRMSEDIRLENQSLRAELNEMKLELKHCMEKIEGPMKEKLEAERAKCCRLQQELCSASHNMLMSEDSHMREMNSLKMQLCVACSNINEMNAINKRLKDEMTGLDCMCAKLEDDLMKQKLSEADTIRRLSKRNSEKVEKCQATGTYEEEPFRCDSNLHVIARKLSKTLKESAPCEECAKLPAELAGAAKCIKDLTDMVESRKNKNSNMDGDIFGGDKKDGESQSSPGKNDECCQCRDCRDIGAGEATVRSACDVPKSGDSVPTKTLLAPMFKDQKDSDIMYSTCNCDEPNIRSPCPCDDENDEPPRAANSTYYSAGGESAAGSKAASRIPSRAPCDDAGPCTVIGKPCHSPGAPCDSDDEQPTRQPGGATVQPCADTALCTVMGKPCGPGKKEPEPPPIEPCGDKAPCTVYGRPCRSLEKDLDEILREEPKRGGEGPCAGGDKQPGKISTCPSCSDTSPCSRGEPCVFELPSQAKKDQIPPPRAEGELSPEAAAEAGILVPTVSATETVHEIAGVLLEGIPEDSAEYDTSLRKSLGPTTDKKAPEEGTLSLVSEMGEELPADVEGVMVPGAATPGGDGAEPGLRDLMEGELRVLEAVSLADDDTKPSGPAGVGQVQEGAIPSATGDRLRPPGELPAGADGSEVPVEGPTYAEAMPGEQPGIQGQQPTFAPGMPGEQPAYASTMPGEQPAFYPAVPGQQPAFYPAVPGEQPTFYPAVPGEQPTFYPAVPGEQPVFYPAVPGQQPSFAPAMPGEQPAFYPAAPGEQPAFYPAVPGEQPAFYPAVPGEQPAFYPAVPGEQPAFYPAMPGEQPTFAPAASEGQTYGEPSMYGALPGEAAAVMSYAADDFEPQGEAQIASPVADMAAPFPREVNLDMDGLTPEQIAAVPAMEVPRSMQADDIFAAQEPQISRTGVPCPFREEKKGAMPFGIATTASVFDQPPPDLHVTTTITGSGTLEVITEGPAGLIETTLIYRDDGTIEVVTQITEPVVEPLITSKTGYTLSETEGGTVDQKMSSFETSVYSAPAESDLQRNLMFPEGPEESLMSGATGLTGRDTISEQATKESTLLSSSYLSDFDRTGAPEVGGGEAAVAAGGGDEAFEVSGMAVAVGAGEKAEGEGAGASELEGAAGADVPPAEGADVPPAEGAEGLVPGEVAADAEAGGEFAKVSAAELKEEAVERELSSLDFEAAESKIAEGEGLAVVEEGLVEGEEGLGEGAEGLEEGAEELAEGEEGLGEFAEGIVEGEEGLEEGEEGLEEGEEGLIEVAEGLEGEESLLEVEEGLEGEELEEEIMEGGEGIIPPTEGEEGLLLAEDEEGYKPPAEGEGEEAAAAAKQWKETSEMDETIASEIDDASGKKTKQRDCACQSSPPIDQSCQCCECKDVGVSTSQDSETITDERMAEVTGKTTVETIPEEVEPTTSQETDIAEAASLGTGKMQGTIDDVTTMNEEEGGAVSVQDEATSKQKTLAEGDAPYTNADDDAYATACETMNTCTEDKGVSDASEITTQNTATDALPGIYCNCYPEDTEGKGQDETLAEQPTPDSSAPIQRDAAIQCDCFVPSEKSEVETDEDKSKSKRSSEVPDSQLPSLESSDSKPRKKRSSKLESMQCLCQGICQCVVCSPEAIARRKELTGSSDPPKGTAGKLCCCILPPRTQTLQDPIQVPMPQVYMQSQMQPFPNHPTGCQCATCICMCNPYAPPATEAFLRSTNLSQGALPKDRKRMSINDVFNPEESQRNKCGAKGKGRKCKKQDRHPPNCECVDCLCLPKIKKIAQTKECPIIKDEKQVYQVHTMKCVCANALNAKKSSRIPIATNSATGPPKVRGHVACTCQACSCSPCSDPNQGAGATGGATGGGGAGAGGGGGGKDLSYLCDCATCDCQVCFNKPKDGREPKQTEEAKQTPSGKNCCCKGECTCDPCPVEALQRMQAKPSQFSTSHPDDCDCAECVCPKSKSRLGETDDQQDQGMAAKGIPFKSSNMSQPADCDCVDCACPKSKSRLGGTDVQLDQGESPIAKSPASLPDDCDCGVCDCTGAPGQRTKPAPGKAAAGEVPPGCECEVCDCPGGPAGTGDSAGAGGPAGRGFGDTTQNPPDCDCDVCECPGMRDGGMKKDGKQPLSATTEGVSLVADCDCQECQCSPCADPKRRTEGGAPNISPCDCADCTCDPCADASRGKGQGGARQVEGHPEDCTCQECICSAESETQTQSNLAHPDNCDCDTCICANEDQAMTSTAVGSTENKATHPPDCICDECRCATEGQDGGADHDTGCTCAECLCKDCIEKQRAESQEECTCGECTCIDCEKMAGAKGKPTAAPTTATQTADAGATCAPSGGKPGSPPASSPGAQAGKGAGCVCAECICVDCAGRAADAGGKSGQPAAAGESGPPVAGAGAAAQQPSSAAGGGGEGQPSAGEAPPFELPVRKRCECLTCDCADCEDKKGGSSAASPTTGTASCTPASARPPGAAPAAAGTVAESGEAQPYKDEPRKVCDCPTCDCANCADKSGARGQTAASGTVKHCDCPTCTCSDEITGQGMVDKEAGRGNFDNKGLQVGKTGEGRGDESQHAMGCSCPDCCACAGATQLPDVSKLGNDELRKQIKSGKKENCECREQIKEIRRTLDKIKCACNEAEMKASQQNTQLKPFVKQASSFGQTMSGLKLALSNLQEKCKAKDRMIDVMTGELKLRSSSNTLDRVLNTRKPEEPPDYDRATDVQSPPRKKEAVPTNVLYPVNEEQEIASTRVRRNNAGRGCDDRASKTKKRSRGCKCGKSHKDRGAINDVDLSGFEIIDIRRITQDSIIIKWKPPRNNVITGYDIFVNGVNKSRVMSGGRTSAMIHSLDLSATIQITIYAVAKSGRCEPPAIAIYEINS